MSWPRSATRTGCDDSGETRYRYHESPREREHHLGVDSLERDDRRLRLAERLGDARDRAPELGRVEELGGLDERDLVVAKPSQDRLAHDRLGLLLAGTEDRLPQRALASPARRDLSIGETDTPSLTQPWSVAASVQSGQTST